LDFQGLHNLAKHNIYLRENCESALATLDALRDHHKLLFGDHPTPSQEITRQALSYQRTLVQSTERRLCSMDRRIVNVIQLSFNIVTQGDSKLMQSESQSMKTIAVMTLFFMPLSTIAGVFGTEFIKIEDGPGNHIKVSQDFWLLFLIAVPLTVAVIVIWRVWYADAKGRLIGKIPHDAKRRMGWETLRWTWGGSNGSGKDCVNLAMHALSPHREV
jgi:Mg2+ and Co2+ transporter CorA